MILASLRANSETFSGTLSTLTLQSKIQIVPATERQGDSSPSHRVFVGRTEIGAAWKRTSQAGKVYYAVKIDDPAFPAPILANLTESDDPEFWRLIWTRQD